ncbi:MAG: hypothetical protein KKE17_15405 [Proteobacteria bacterium]|nr:hypothetical protein [Pseudomonadota bacterium]MBU1711387.1 hypothetical protein [Pseudomonadota bacterium]
MTKKTPSAKPPVPVKIKFPRLEHYLKRLRVFSLFDQACTKPVVWVYAPPGQGKTWAVCSYLKERRIKPLWYQIDERDSDPATFINFLNLAVRQSAPRYRKQLPCLTPEYNFDLATFSRNYFEEIYQVLPKGFVMVFDNYQILAPDAQVHDMLRVAAEILPEEGRIIFISREPSTPSFVRLTAGQSLSFITNHDLEFTRDETEAFLSARHPQTLTPEDIDAIQAKYHGWVAGMVLHSRFDFVSDMNNKVPHSSPEEVFSFLSEEVFNRMPNPQRDILLKSALLPEMTSVSVNALTGDGQAGDLIKKFHKNGYFTTRHDPVTAIYQFHPMFREFLLEKGKVAYPREHIQDLQRQAAALLLEDGMAEEASLLLQDAEDWIGLSEFILANSRPYLEQGRFRALLSLVDALPPAHQKAPWINYWAGTALLSVDPLAARRRFKEALHTFEKEKLEDGMCLSWAGMIDSHFFIWDDFAPLDDWKIWMDDFLAGKPSISSPEILARVAFGMFGLLLYRSPGHADMPKWSEQVAMICKTAPNINHRFAMATQYLIYLIWMGSFSEATIFINHMVHGADLDKVEPFYLLPWLQTEAMFYWLNGDFEKSSARANKGLALADKSGIHIFDFVLRAQNCYLTLESADPEERCRALAKLSAVKDLFGKLNQGHFNFVAALYALADNEEERALIHMKKSLDFAIERGGVFPEGLSTIGMGAVLIELARYDEAEQYFNRAGEIAAHIKSLYLDYSRHLGLAELAFVQGLKKKGLKFLAQGLAIGRAKEIYNLDWWRPQTMNNLLITALENDLETAHVRKMIRKRKVVPKSPPLHLTNWPWEVRIYTLGRFSIVVEDRSLRLNVKTGKKTLELLMAMIAFGGRAVPEEKLADCLWPDADGDAAHSSFTTTLSRLRKIIPGDILVMNHGKLTIDDRRCWVDTWALERNLGEVEKLLAGPTDSRNAAFEQIQQSLSLYKGPFLVNDAQAGWAIGPRERLHLKVLRTIERLMAIFKQSGDCLALTPLYEKALELDPLTEEYYQGLMECYVSLGDSSRALAVYTRCCEQLSDAFGIEPSAKTQSLRQRIVSR